MAELLESFDKRRSVYLGSGAYKLRLRSPDIKGRESRSFRLLVLAVEAEGCLVPVCLYFKGDRGNISKRKISEPLRAILFEMKSGDEKMRTEGQPPS